MRAELSYNLIENARFNLKIDKFKARQTPYFKSKHHKN
jgi:hypothetical protein